MVMTRDQTEPEYEIPDLYPQQTSRKDQGNIELTQCPAYGVVPM